MGYWAIWPAPDWLVCGLPPTAAASYLFLFSSAPQITIVIICHLRPLGDSLIPRRRDGVRLAGDEHLVVADQRLGSRQSITGSGNPLLWIGPRCEPYCLSSESVFFARRPRWWPSPNHAMVRQGFLPCGSYRWRIWRNRFWLLVLAQILSGITDRESQLSCLCPPIGPHRV
jgi:hypothetical protein